MQDHIQLDYLSSYLIITGGEHVSGFRRSTSRSRWALHDAKNKLSEVVDAAARGEPQVVTRRGVETAVVISYAEYERITAARSRQMPSFAEYLLAMPTARGAAGAIERIELPPRDEDV